MTDTLPAFPLDHLALRGAPDGPALRIKDKVYSYQELNHRIGRLAVILRAQDFTVGDRIATWLPKTELACLMPLAAVRAISDRADDAAHVDFPRFIQRIASRYSAAVLDRLLATLPPR